MFGYDGLDLDNLRDPCVMDFTEEFSTKLCYVENCKSPTLDLLGLETNPSCSADKTTNLGKWQIYYSCEFQSKDSSTSIENQTVLEENGISNEVNIYNENISKNEPGPCFRVLCCYSFDLFCTRFRGPQFRYFNF